MAKATEDKAKIERKKLAKIKESEIKIVETEAEEIIEEAKVESTAKAGKRSAKAQTEAEEKQAKEERKTETKAKSEKPKITVKPTRPKSERRSKKYKQAAEEIDADKQYSMKEALETACKTSTTKFDSTVEMHIRLNVDPRQADQNIRDSVIMPAGTGKTLKIAVFAEEDAAKAAIKAGADMAGTDEITKALDKGIVEFDVLIAPPNLMAKLAKYARLLGPKGLMPNPKSGTVTADVVKGVEQAKAGRIEYRVDSTGIIHSPIGKVSFKADKLLENANSLTDSIKQNKPTGLKGVYVKSIVVTTTMGPGIHVSNNEIS